MRVYRIPYSTNVERVALALAHKSMPVEWVDVDRFAAQQGVVESDGVRVFELVCQDVKWETSPGQLQDAGRMGDEHASLAKAFCTVRMRETTSWARELLGGNGILLENHVGRFVADAEAIYSYEGTREINTLIVGRAITGLGAFV